MGSCRVPAQAYCMIAVVRVWSTSNIYVAQYSSNATENTTMLDMILLTNASSDV
jgi:hypothetical protein